MLNSIWCFWPIWISWIELPSPWRSCPMTTFCRSPKSTASTSNWSTYNKYKTLAETNSTSNCSTYNKYKTLAETNSTSNCSTHVPTINTRHELRQSPPQTSLPTTNTRHELRQSPPQAGPKSKKIHGRILISTQNISDNLNFNINPESNWI